MELRIRTEESTPGSKPRVHIVIREGNNEKKILNEFEKEIKIKNSGEKIISTERLPD